MLMIEQTWEKRNLGVNALEFQFDGTERVDEISDTVLNNTEYDYQICRVPAGQMDVAYLLQENGFRFAEGSFELVADLKNFSIPENFDKYITQITYHEADARELVEIHQHIRDGMFDTDRIYFDPFFRKEQSGIRFSNWCQQELDNKTTKCFVVEGEDKLIGFFALKEISAKIGNSLLAGLFDKESSMGLGASVLYFPMKQAELEGKKKIVTNVSSNNLSSLKMHLHLGYKVKAVNYIFVKHLKEHSEKGKGYKVE